MLKLSYWCIQSFLPLPYPFTWCLMPLSYPEGMFLVCPSLVHGFQLSSPWSGGCGLRQSVLWCIKPALSRMPRESWNIRGHKTHASCRGSFTFQDFTSRQFHHFFTWNFPLPAWSCSTQLWSPGVQSRQFLSQLFHGLWGQEEPT